MKFKLTNPVLDYKGKPQMNGDKPLDWREVIYQALNSMFPDERPSADEKYKCYKITQKAFQSDEVDYDAEEIALIIQKIGVIYNPLIYGHAKEFFNKESKEQADVSSPPPK